MKPAVLLPGTLCDERIFGAIQKHLAQSQVLDFSPWPDTHAAAAALIDQVPPHSVGIAFSLGSWVLLEMLKLAPTRFDGIVLISGNAHPDVPENAAMRRDRVRFAKQNGFEALFANDWPAMLGQGHVENKEIRTAILSMAESAGHDLHERQAEANISRPDLRAFVNSPPMPLHVIAGAEDGLCPRDRYEAVVAGAGSSLTLVDGAGHYLPLEAPDAVIEFLLSHFPEICA